MNPIDRSSAIPLYFQVAQHLRAEIQAGRIMLGQKLPSERDLMLQFSVSRNTVRQAVDLMVQEGLVYQDHGRGNYTIGTGLNIQYRIDTFVEHNEFLRRVGSVPRVEHIDTRQAPADETVAKMLHLKSGEEVVCFAKMFYANNSPAILTYDYVPLRWLPEDYDRSGSGQTFFRLLEDLNNKPVKFTLSDIVPVVASEIVARYLCLPPGSPVLLLQETFLDPSKNVPLCFSLNYYHPDIHFRILRRRA